MHSRTVLVSASLALCALGSRATTFPIDWEGRATVDPAVDFETDCLGDVAADDCDERASALEAELVENLVALSFETDVETVALFEEVLPLGRPRVQEVALEFFATQPTPPTGIWDQVRLFFFGPDAGVGFPAALLLGVSTDANEMQMSQLYLEGRTVETHGGWFPVGDELSDSWAEGRARDLWLDDVEGFDDSARFPDGARLLMLDRVVLDPFASDEAVEVAVTAFVTAATEEEVRAHFTALFGREPYVSVDDATTRQEEITAEMETLQEGLESGDQDAIERFTELSNELMALQQGTLIAARISLTQIGAGDAVYWSDLAPDTATEGPMLRSVAVSLEPTLARIAIRYFVGAVGDGLPAEGEGEGEGEDGGSAEGDDDASGCSCGAVRSANDGWAAALALALAIALCRRPGRRTRRAIF